MGISYFGSFIFMSNSPLFTFFCISSNKGVGLFFESYLHICSSKWALAGTQMKAKKLLFHEVKWILQHLKLVKFYLYSKCICLAKMQN